MSHDSEAATYRVEVRAEGNAWDAVGHGVSWETADRMLTYEREHGREARAVDLATSEVLPDPVASVAPRRVLPPTFSHAETVQLWHALSQYLENSDDEALTITHLRGRTVAAGLDRHEAEAALDKLDAYVASLAEVAS